VNRQSREGDSPAPRPARSVFIVTHSHYPDDVRTEKEALALRDAGWSVTVFCLRRPRQPGREVAQGVEVRRLPIEHKRGGAARYLVEYFGFFLLAGWSVSLLAVARRPFAVQVSNPPDFLVFVGLVPRLIGASVVLDMHEPVPELYASIFGVPLSAARIRALALVERIACSFASRVITVSEICRRTFSRRGTPAGKIAVVMNVCEARRFDPARFRGEDGGGPESAPSAGRPFRLVTHSTLMPRYGIDVAVRAMAILRERVPEARLDVYGRGDARDDLERLVRELGLSDRVALHGHVDLTALPEKIAGADAGLVPHRKDVFTDLVLPTKLFEYIAMEKPAVVARTRGILEHFGGEDLYLFDAEDAEGLARAVAEIRARPDEARARARRLRARFERETWEHARAGYVAIFDRLKGPD
jgi:glycosyltransferase involved in cell wall biosynthesis